MHTDAIDLVSEEDAYERVFKQRMMKIVRTYSEKFFADTKIRAEDATIGDCVMYMLPQHVLHGLFGHAFEAAGLESNTANYLRFLRILLLLSRTGDSIEMLYRDSNRIRPPKGIMEEKEFRSALRHLQPWTDAESKVDKVGFGAIDGRYFVSTKFSYYFHENVIVVSCVPVGATKVAAMLSLVNHQLSKLYVPGANGSLLSVDDDHLRSRSKEVALHRIKTMNNPRKADGPVLDVTCCALTGTQCTLQCED